MSNDPVTKNIDGVDFTLNAYKNHTGSFANHRFLDSQSTREDHYGDLMYDQVHTDFLNGDKIDVDAAIASWQDANDPDMDDASSVSSDSLDKFANGRHSSIPPNSMLFAQPERSAAIRATLSRPA